MKGQERFFGVMTEKCHEWATDCKHAVALKLNEIPEEFVFNVNVRKIIQLLSRYHSITQSVHSTQVKNASRPSIIIADKLVFSFCAINHIRRRKRID